MKENQKLPNSRALEADLVFAAAGGDVEAFSELVRTYTKSVCAIAYDILRDYYLAQDIAQDTFVKAFRSLSSLKRAQSFASWIYSIATHLSIDCLRSRKRRFRLQQKLGQHMERCQDSEAEDLIIHQEMRLDVKQALQQLDETSRVILQAYYVSEMKMPEIARMLQLSVTAVESRIRRSRKVLRESQLSAWAAHFRNNNPTDKLVVHVMERLVKQTGQYYIPVANRRRSTDWFVSVLGIGLDHNGHILLPSGHSLFLIEVSDTVLRERSSLQRPSIVFMIEDEDYFCRALKERGVRIMRDEVVGAGVSILQFWDLDGNRYGAQAIV